MFFLGRSIGAAHASAAGGAVIASGRATSTSAIGVVPHICALDDIDHLFGQVLRVVTHALDGLGHKHQVDRLDEIVRGIFHHERDQLSHQSFELLVDEVVTA
jgi:hypothetical protein